MAILATLFVGMLWMSPAARAENWIRLGIAPIPVPFADSRAVASGWECTHRGLNVLLQNPCDPYKRVMQYPKLWMLPAAWGLGSGATDWLGILNAVAVLSAVVLVIGRLARAWEALLYLALLASPPVVLLLERGNVDGLIFAMVCFGVVAWAARGVAIRAVGLGLILLASMLKLYPLVVVWVLARRGGRRAWAALAVAVAAFGVYLAATAKEVSMIAAATQQGIFPAYGLNVLVVAVRHPGVHDGAPLLALAHNRGDLVLRVVGAVLVVAVAAVVARRMGQRDGPGTGPDSSSRLDLLLAGASIYVASFLVFVNWDYRLTFLLMAVPQLLAWSRSALPARKSVARAVVVTLVTAFLTSRFSTDAPVLYGLGQASKAILCVLLLSFLLAELGERTRVWRPRWPGRRRALEGGASTGIA
jgi:Glycosyltransferase family 87